jgi:polyhydroxyalkanoate synthesis regulator phasin
MIAVSPANLSAEQAKELTDELSALSKQQSKALQSAAYTRMSKEEAKEYDQRRVRIAEICALVGTFKPSGR